MPPSFSCSPSSGGLEHVDDLGSGGGLAELGDDSPRPEWFSGVDDLAVTYLDLLEDRDLRDVVVLGSSFGGWVAAEAAIQVHAYGGADQLTLDQIPRPEPGDGEALVRVHAAGVNPIDWKLREGVRRDVMPMRFPYVPGVDLAGVVERVGPGVTVVRPDQEVFGRAAHGSYAEYAIAPAEALAPKPATVGFDEAATIPLGATTAWQGLFDHGHLEPGQRVLILGGAGGVGLFAVQFAHWTGAEVIATASARNADFVRALGAQTVIDYTTTPVADAARDVDLVFDTVGGEAARRRLARAQAGRRAGVDRRSTR